MGNCSSYRYNIAASDSRGQDISSHGIGLDFLIILASAPKELIHVIHWPAIIWTKHDLLWTGPLRINFSEIQVKKMHLETLSAIWQPFCPAPLVLHLLVLRQEYSKRITSTLWWLMAWFLRSPGQNILALVPKGYNIIATNDLAPFITRSSAAMVLTMHGKQDFLLVSSNDSYC